jgi:hypothetical protein
MRGAGGVASWTEYPGVYNQGPGNCGSGRVNPPNRGTRGTTIKTKNTPKQCEVLQGVTNLWSDRPKERKTCDLNNELAKAQIRVRHRGQQDGDTTTAAAGDWEKAVQASTRQTDAAVNPPRIEVGGLLNAPTIGPKHT